MKGIAHQVLALSAAALLCGAAANTVGPRRIP